MKLFGTSGIRGTYGKEINEELAFKLGSCLSEKIVGIGMDVRLSCDSLKKNILKGLNKVIDFGLVPTPVLCFGVSKYAEKGIMITASHCPKEMNGFKLWKNTGEAIGTEEEEEIEKNLLNCNFNEKKCMLEKKNIFDEYVENVRSHIGRINADVFVDAGNGAASEIAPKLLHELGVKVSKINCEYDGNFPTRGPEPNEKTLEEVRKVTKGKICFCFDGDADRLVVIDENGEVADADKFLALMCKKMIEETGIEMIVTTIAASKCVEDFLSKEVEVLRVAVGDRNVADGIKKTNACFGGEPSGHFIFPEHGLYGDGIYAAAKILKLLNGKRLADELAKIDKCPSAKEKINCQREMKHKLVEGLEIPLGVLNVNRLDGLLMEYKDALVLVRASGTEDIIRLNVEAENEKRVDELKEFWNNKIRALI